jgi:hypothetical protein
VEKTEAQAAMREKLLEITSKFAFGNQPENEEEVDEEVFDEEDFDEEGFDDFVDEELDFDEESDEGDF